MHQVPRRQIVPACNLTVTAACFFLAACAVPPSSEGDLAPERLAQLQRICAGTMKLDRGTVHFEDCMDVLSEAARKVDQPKARP